MNYQKSWREHHDLESVTAVTVLGNGPSLRGVDLRQLSDRPSIGMNASYRHWDRIGWYPTFYCCLDDVVVQSHADEIARLLNQQLVQGAFLSGRFFEVKPEFLGDSRILDLDRVSSFWFQSQGINRGKQFVYHQAFMSCYPTLITTGAWALRWAAFMGFSQSCVFGIDMSYNDLPLDYVAPTGNHMKMMATPDHNANYFFDDYQQEGDEFQKPNPIPERPNMHFEALTALSHDFTQQRVGCEIHVAQPESGLGRSNLFQVRAACSVLALAAGSG